MTGHDHDRHTISPAIGIMLNQGDQFDSYEIVRPLGSGATGVVYLASNLALDSMVAIKVLREAGGHNQAMLRRLKREAQLASQLDHPNIARALAFGINQSQAYVVYEYVAGCSLDAELKRRTFTDEEIVGIFCSLALALQAAHDRDIVHRDVKPSNVQITADNEPKLLDFGAARILTADDRITKTADLIGTPIYMSPEQCSGADVDGRSDLYSLGCVLYEVLSGEPPFTGSQPVEIILKHAKEPPPVIGSDRPSALKQIAYKLLSKQPENRYSSGREVADALSRADLNTLDPPNLARPTIPKTWLIAAGMILVLAVSFSTLIMLARKTDQPATDANRAITHMQDAIAHHDIDRAQLIFDTKIKDRSTSPRLEKLLRELINAQRAAGQNKIADADELSELKILEANYGSNSDELLLALQGKCFRDLLDNSCGLDTVRAADRSVVIVTDRINRTLNKRASTSENEAAPSVITRAMVHAFTDPRTEQAAIYMKQARDAAIKYGAMLHPVFLIEFWLRYGGFCQSRKDITEHNAAVIAAAEVAVKAVNTIPPDLVAAIDQELANMGEPSVEARLAHDKDKEAERRSR